MRRYQVTFSGLVLALVLVGLPWANPAQAGDVQEANAGRGGEPLEIRSLAVAGQYTLIDFHSPYCPPCVRLAPLLEQLVQRRSDLSVRKVNINRPNFQGIDWKSPLAQQYQLRSVPFFVIFNPQGKIAAQGPTATGQVEKWLKEAGLLGN
jgi:thiol-disulfide isomerase/thioredoxin